MMNDPAHYIEDARASLDVVADELTMLAIIVIAIGFAVVRHFKK